MDLASSPIRVEKNKVGPGVADVPKKQLDRWDAKHEIVALILTGIRGRALKRRKRCGGEERCGPRWPVPPPFVLAKSAELHENKGVGFCPCARKRKRVRKRMIVKEL